MKVELNFTENGLSDGEFNTLNNMLKGFDYELVELNRAKNNTVECDEPKTEKTTPTIVEGEKDAEEPKKVATKKAAKTTITLADLKESAKNASVRLDRKDVLATINEFAPKLAEVDEADYGKLYKKLQELGV